MKNIWFLLSFTMLVLPLAAQEIAPPLVKNNYARATSYDEISVYLQLLDKGSDLLTVEKSGTSVLGRNLYALKFSSSKFGNDPSKIKVLILAQQHGNEQSGKEGALLLANELLKPSNRHLFELIDLLVIPQMNPDGSELNRRENENGQDLNRNHLILTEPETIALHSLFDQYLFEVTLDVHEYFPYGETWKKLGYRKNSDETLGSTDNINIAESIKDLSNNSYVPFLQKYFAKRHVTFFTYCPGGPPEIDYIRHSTFDINDGRQSFGIQNTFSFIQEGKNGEDNYIENIKHRAEGQMTGMMALLEYVYQNKGIIMKMVSDERTKLIGEVPGNSISIQSEHVRNGEILKLPVYSYFSKTDSVVDVKDYRPVVKSLCDVSKPAGYLIPKRVKELTDWVERQGLSSKNYVRGKGDKVEQYYIDKIDSIDFEGDIIVNPVVSATEFHGTITPEDYIYITVSQLKGNLIVLALEPKSMLGLVTYKNYSHLLKTGGKYPVLRVVKRK
jgi:hypothetical protein